MQLLAALIYWVIVALWLGVLATVVMAFLRSPRTFGAIRLLLAVVATDTARNIIENVYFGLFFGSQYGLFPAAIGSVLGQPHLLIAPKVANVVASLVVLGLLLWHWLPTVNREWSSVVSELAQAEKRFRLLVHGVKEYAICWLDPHGFVTSWNAGAERIKGYSSSEAIGKHMDQFNTERDRLAGASARMLQIAEREGHFEADAVRVRKDGSTFWANVALDAIRDDHGKLIGFAKITKDISEKKAAEERLQQLAMFDELTGLPNRNRLLTDLAENLKNESEAPPLTLILINLDSFKEVNDTLGHATGDAVLKQVAQRLLFGLIRTGVVYRIGGDAFAVTLPGVQDPLPASDCAAALLRKFDEPIEAEGRRIFVGARLGIAIAPAHGTSVDELMANADLALHEAKRLGGRRCTLFAPSFRAALVAKQEIDTELRRAFAEGEFVVHYQPQIRLSDTALVGVEALLRWRHPQRGLLAPGAFIDALVASPMALQVGTWILETACEYAAEWRRAGFPLRVGVNMFPDQLNDPALLQTVKEVLERTGLPASALELEITENIMLAPDEATINRLALLRELGVGLAFDDFGTGFASLSYLTRYPLTRIKIDRSFVSKITTDSTAMDTAVVRSVITMAHNLGLEVIAEGVETPAQAAFLHMRGCEEGQGFLYGKPEPGAQLFEMFSGRASEGRPRQRA